VGPIAERLAILLDVFSPWERISLTYRQFAAEIGEPSDRGCGEEMAPAQEVFPADAARLIVTKARDRGLMGGTLEWVLWAKELGPKAPRTTPNRPAVRRSAPSRGTGRTRGAPRASATGGGSGAFRPERIAKALEADLSHNEFGQWSSVEVQHTVIWGAQGSGTTALGAAIRPWARHSN